MDGKTQLITVGPDGVLHALRVKQDDGLDLRLVRGTFAVRRVSEIMWEADKSGYTVNLKPEDGREERVLTLKMCQDVGISFQSLQEHYGPLAVHCFGGVLSFEDYDTAVAVEVSYLRKAKEKGVCEFW